MSYFSQKFIVAALLMFSLIGQSSASLMMPCDMMNMTDMEMPHNMSMSMSMSEHSMHMTMNGESTASSTTSDCCESHCDCPTTCGHSNYLANSLIKLTVMPIHPQSNRHNITFPQQQFLSYLFKPPIL